LHYFRRQNASNKGDSLDQNLILQGSLAGYLDLPGALQYASSKYALRGMMKALRKTEHQHNIRVNFIGPWYGVSRGCCVCQCLTRVTRFIETKILSKQAVEHLSGQGVKFATVEDAGQCLMRIVSDPKVNGRAFAIVTRDLAPRGYVDIDIDDYDPGTLLGTLQAGTGVGGNHRAVVG
jgi:NAD(P)-dependent dehydrogenase (short-subunit alcohol dehydrogenase family)